MAGAGEFDSIIAAIRRDLTLATEVLMTVAEGGLTDVGLARTGDDKALSRMESKFLAVLEACALEDLIGQRLTQLQAAASGSSPTAPTVRDHALLNGPALPGQGLDQGEADSWLRSNV